MKRIASLLSAAALAGSLVAAPDSAKADSALYLVPISDLNATYAPGATVQFAAVLDLGGSAFSAFSVPAAVAYIASEVGAAKPTAAYDLTADPLRPSIPFWSLTAPIYYATTASFLNGAKVQTIQPTAGHAAVSSGTGLFTVPSGTYTIATFSFPISSTNASGSATVSLPTPFGYTNSGFTADGGYLTGTGPTLTIKGSDVNGDPISDPLTFPNSGAKHSSLTFNVTHPPHAEMYLVPISDITAAYNPGATVQFAAVMTMESGAFSAFSVPAAVAYTTSEFGSAKPTAVYDTTADPLNPAAPFWSLTAPIYYATTASFLNGAKVQTIQPTAGHAAVSRASGLLPVSAGIYTIATFNFPISPTNIDGSATVYLPTPFGYSNSGFSTDGGYLTGTGPTLTIKGSDVNTNPLSIPLVFPNSDLKRSSLTFRVNIPMAALTGTLQFLDISPNAAAQRVTFQFRDPNTGVVLATQIVNVPASGAFTLAPVTLRPYTLWVKPDKYLARTAPVLVSGNNFAPITLAFEGGDANNDNSVDTSDFGLLVGAYRGSATIPGSGYDLRADFNGDGVVNATDLSILAGSYNETGEL